MGAIATASAVLLGVLAAVGSPSMGGAVFLLAALSFRSFGRPQLVMSAQLPAFAVVRLAAFLVARGSSPLADDR